jgi:integrase
MANKKIRRRANGDGSIYLDKKRNKLVAAITGPDGHRITKRFPVDSRQAARDWLVQQQSDISQGDYVPRTDVTLGDWMVTFIRTYKSGLKPITINNYYFCAGQLAPLAGIPLQDVSPVILQKYFNNLTCAHSSRKQIRTFLSMSLRKALSLQMIRRNPLDGVEVKGGAPPHKISVFTQAEIAKILTVSKKYNPGVYALILTAVYTGMRAGELLALHWSDVDLLHGVIHVSHNVVHIHKKYILQQTPKTSASCRDITIPPRLVEVLFARKHRKIASIDINDRCVFTGIRHQDIIADEMRYYWDRVQQLAGISHHKFHTLRHTHASQLLAAGVPITEVSRRLGHASPDVTLKIYSHFIPGNDRAVADRVQDIFGS